jgi:hypothetical protein
MYIELLEPYRCRCHYSLPCRYRFHGVDCSLRHAVIPHIPAPAPYLYRSDRHAGTLCGSTAEIKE